MIRVVIDANVLVSAALARDPAAPSVRVFDALLDGRIQAVGCPALLGEVAAVLGRERLRRYLSIEEARRFVSDLAGSWRWLRIHHRRTRLSAETLTTTISSRSPGQQSSMRS